MDIRRLGRSTPRVAGCRPTLGHFPAKHCPTGRYTPTAAAATLEPSTSGQGQCSYESRVVGSLLGAMCGSVLGAPVQSDRTYQVTRQHAEGLTDFYRFDFGARAVPYGHYTGDYSQLLAVARSLTQHSLASAPYLLDQLLQQFQPDQRRYRTYDVLVAEAVLSGSSPLEVSALAGQYLAEVTSRQANTSSDRPDREPYGPSDFGAAARVAPIGLAYRNASPDLLLKATYQNCVFSHAHPLAVDSSRVMAAATAWLSQQQPGSVGCTPDALLQHLLEVAVTEDMVGKLQLLRGNSFQMDWVSRWRPYFASKQWHDVTSILNLLTFHSFATTGSEAVAVALWALLINWQQPEQAVITAATFGGNSDAVAQMTGALAGALHGGDWIPKRWWGALENGTDGRDEVVAVARKLAALDCADVGVWGEEGSELGGAGAGSAALQ